MVGLASPRESFFDGRSLHARAAADLEHFLMGEKSYAVMKCAELC